MIALMTVFIVLGSIGTYLTGGALYARSQSIRLYRARRQHEKTLYPTLARDKAWLDNEVATHVREQLWVRFWFWPVAAVYDACRRADGLTPFGGPIRALRQQAADLAEQADQYEALIRGCSDPVDRDLMRKGQRALREQARKVDL